MILPPENDNSGSGPPPVPDILQTTTVTLSSAQLLALNTAPAVLLAPPGAGKYNLIMAASFELIFGTTEYTPAGDESVFFGSVTGTINGNLLPAFQDAFASGSSNVTFTTRNSASAATPTLENQALVLGSPSANATGGDGTMSITLYYVTVTL